MPIRLNLLAEAQAAEEMRRRDPVKRNIWFAVLLVVCVLGYYAYLLAGHMSTKATLTKLESSYAPLKKSETETKGRIVRTGDVQRRLEQLNSLAAERFLWATFFDALQDIKMQDVPIVSIKTEQRFDLDIPVAPPGSKTPPKIPPSSTERVSILINAKNYNPDGPNAGQFRDALANHPYFKTLLEAGQKKPSGEDSGSIKAQGILSPIATDPDGKAFRPFRVQIELPPKLRK